MEKYLSLLLSYCDNLSISYRNYRVIDGSPLKTKPALIFEKVCADNTLYLRLVDALSGFEPDFVEEYNLSRVVMVNDLEQVITVHEVEHAGHYQAYKKLKSHLNRLHRELNLLGSGYYEDGDLFIIDSELAEALVYEKLPALAKECMVYGAEDLKSYRVRKAKPELKLSMTHGIDFLEGEVRLYFGDEVFSLFEVLHHYRKNAYIQLSDGERVLLDDDYVDRLERIFRNKGRQKQISFFDLPEVEELIGKRLSGDELKSPVNSMKDLTISIRKRFLFQHYSCSRDHTRKRGSGGWIICIGTGWAVALRTIWDWERRYRPLPC